MNPSGSFQKKNVMFLKNSNNKLLISAALLGSLITSTGCKMVYDDDLPGCEAKLRVRFVYEYHLKDSDAFAKEVKSVNVWAFDKAGSLAWSGSASGDVLKEKDFALDTSLPAGTYDFVSWCGLKDNGDFDLATYTPASKEELEVKLRTLEKDGENVSSSFIPGLFHGLALEETFTIEPNTNTLKTVTIPLMKDTNNIRVLLQRMGTTPLEKNDFDASLTITDAWLAWDNAVMPQSPTVTYTPWDIRPVSATVETPPSGPEVTSLSGQLFDFTSSRLIAGSDATLTIHRNSDGVDIIRIPIVDYFIAVKGHYGDMSDQEYLDRQDDYSILLFVDDNNELYAAAGIYINSWAVVPPQTNPF